MFDDDIEACSAAKAAFVQLIEPEPLHLDNFFEDVDDGHDGEKEHVWDLWNFSDQSTGGASDFQNMIFLCGKLGVDVLATVQEL